jgi:hypothetical protein
MTLVANAPCAIPVNNSTFVASGSNFGCVIGREAVPLRRTGSVLRTLCKNTTEVTMANRKPVCKRCDMTLNSREQGYSNASDDEGVGD